MENWQFSMYGVTYADYQKLFNDNLPEDDKLAVMCKAAGISIDDLKEMSVIDVAQFQTAFWACSNRQIDEAKKAARQHFSG